MVRRDHLVAVGGGKRRSLLAILLLHANEVVHADRLIDQLWDERPPSTAGKSVHVYVSQLRKALAEPGEEDLLVTHGHGYLLRVDPDALDVARFERLAGDGLRALASGDPTRSAERLRQALALWRGPPLVDFAYERFAQREISRLQEQRLLVLEARIDAELRTGAHAELIAELETLVDEHPLRERLRGQLMLALYRCGRQAEALDSYRRGRDALVEELGIEPGPALRALHDEVLRQSPELAAPSLPPARLVAELRRAPATRARRPLVVLLAAGALLLGAVGLATLSERGGGSALRARPSTLNLAVNSVAAVSPRTGAPQLALPLPGRVIDLAAARGAVWAVTVRSPSLTTVDPSAGTITRSVPLPGTPDAVAVGAGTAWVIDGRRSLLLGVEPGHRGVSARIPLPRAGPSEGASIAAGAGGVWVTDGSDRLARVDAATHAVMLIRTGRPLSDVTLGSGAVWALSERRPGVLRIDPRTGSVTDLIPLAARRGARAPAAVVASAGAVWVLNRDSATVARIDPGRADVASVIRIGAARMPSGIAAAGRSAFVANGDGTLSRIDEATNRASSLWVGEPLRTVAADRARVWVGTARAGAPG